MTTVTDSVEECPSCGATWLDKEIPEADREHYGGRTHFLRSIAIYNLDLDRTTHFMCPDCGETFERA